MKLFRNDGQGRAGDRSSQLLSAGVNDGADDAPDRRRDDSGAGTKHSVPRALSARQGSAEEEERLCHVCNGRGYFPGNWVFEDDDCKTCKGTGKRPDETATGERGVVRSGLALTYQDCLDALRIIDHEIDMAIECDVDDPHRAEAIIETLKRNGFFLSRISGDGTSERRADNAYSTDTRQRTRRMSGPIRLEKKCNERKAKEVSCRLGGERSSPLL